jgi:cytochrome c peroxidase
MRPPLPLSPLNWSATAAAVCLLVALGASVVLAQAPSYLLSSLFPSTAMPSNQEPITPIPSPPAADPLKLALGEQLFQDPLLSHDQTVACASCHDTRSNGADGLRHAKGADGSPLAFNTPTVFNATLSFRLNWEGNQRTLESQAESTLNGGPGTGSNMQEVLGRLNSKPDTVRQFVAVYGRDPDRASLLDALATYERSLVTPDSRFDRWLEGDHEALSAKELSGYAVFKSFGCISCHQGVNVGGNLFQRHGIFHPLASPEPKILRVPSLRNVATTPPYFHDGSAATLADAVRRMAAAQLDQSLSEPEIDAIVAFLDSLTGTYRGSPVKAAAP